MNQSADNIFTVDLEDWVQSSLMIFPESAKKALAGRPPTRVMENAGLLLDLLEAHGVRATWFVLGPVAEAHPGLIRRIAEAGHEIASHGYGHELVYTLTPERFREDLRRGAGVVEDACGKKVAGYRAPYFSITPQAAWALDELAEAGFTWDSSLFPISRGLYGFPGAERFPSRLANGLWEFPVATARLAGKTLPVGGGGYFRIFPYAALSLAYRRIANKGRPLVFYMHPYELDTVELAQSFAHEDFRMRLVKLQQAFGRGRFAAKLKRLLTAHSFGTVSGWLAARERGGG